MFKCFQSLLIAFAVCTVLLIAVFIKELLLMLVKKLLKFYPYTGAHASPYDLHLHPAKC